MPRQFGWIDQRLVRDRPIQGRSSQALALCPFKPLIIRWLARHPYSATRIYQRLCGEEAAPAASAS